MVRKYIIFNTQKPNQAANAFDKDFYKLLNYAFYGKTMEILRNRLSEESIRKNDTEKIVKQQSKSTFNGVLKN